MYEANLSWSKLQDSFKKLEAKNLIYTETDESTRRRRLRLTESGVIFLARHKATEDLLSNMKKIDQPKGESPSQLIDAKMKELGDWRGETLSRIRALIKQADLAVVEELKWKKPSNPRGVPVWSHDGIICTGETYKNIVKLTFAKGAQLKDPKKLFNSSLEGNTRRAIDFHEGDKVDGEALKALVREAVALNISSNRV
jgi:hypothetical protein